MSDQWNPGENKFPSFVGSEIISIPLPASDKEDSRFWRHDKKGKYSVREGYRLGIGLYTRPENQSEVTMESRWKFIWSLSLPPKVRIFWWKIYHDAIATCWNLLSHHVPLTGRCPLCNFMMDTTSQALFSCVKSKAYRKETDFYDYIDSIKCHDSREICFQLMNELGRKKFEKMAICTWAICRERSSLLHTEGGRTHSTSIGWCLEFLDAYQNTKCIERPASASGTVDSPTRWLPPPSGYLRLDVDASYNTNLNAYAIGGAVRDHQGKLICAFEQKIKQPLSVTQGELLALHEGLKILRDKNYQGVHVASDSLLAVQAVTMPHEDLGYMGTIAAEIGELIKGPMERNYTISNDRLTRWQMLWQNFLFLLPHFFFWGSGDFPFSLDKLVSDDFLIE